MGGNCSKMEIPLEIKLLHAIEKDNLKLVTKLVAKGANPNRALGHGRTCLGEAIVRGLNDIAKVLIDVSHDKKHVFDGDEKDRLTFNIENDSSLKGEKYSARKLTFKRHFEMWSMYITNATEGYHKLSERLSTSDADRATFSEDSDLEWDEDIGGVAAKTKEDDAIAEMYKWYASILENTGAAMTIASDITNGIDQEDAFGKTALDYACDEENFEIFKALIDAGYKIDYPATASGWTALHTACATNRVDFVEAVLAAGANVNRRTPTKSTALHIAVGQTFEMTTLLVEHGAILDARDDKDRTALFMAAMRGRTDIVDFLVARGANINIEDSQGHTPLCIAVYRDHVRIVDQLLCSGARVTHHQCLLHTAVKLNKLKMVRLLAERGCGINVHSADGDTPLLLAMRVSCPLTIIKALLKRGANVNACNSKTGASALHIAVDVVEDPEDFELILNTLLDYSIDMDKRASTRDTALNKAVLIRKNQIAAELIRYGADVNLCDVLNNVFGNLVIASNRRTNKLANILIKAGHYDVGLNIDQDSGTAKWIAEMYKTPLSLANICRIRIRNLPKSMNLRDFVKALPIPELLKKFLMMKDLIW